MKTGMYRRLYRVSMTALVSALVGLLLLSPFQITAQSVDESTPVAVAQEPTVEPPPTELPPTETPTPEPIATDTPTLVPTATELPATATPSRVPATDTPIPTATASPTATPSPTPTFETQTSSLAATTTEPASCTLDSPSTAITGAGQYVTYQCSSGGVSPFKIYPSSLTAGWEWAYNLTTNGTPSNWTTSTSATSSSGNGPTIAYVYLRPVSVPPANTNGLLVIKIAAPGGPDQSDPALNLAATFAGLNAANFTLSCTATTVTVAAAGTGTSTCTLSPVGVPGATTVAVNNVAIAPVTGWTLSVSPSIGAFTGATSFTFTMSATPGCSAETNPTAPNVQITASLTSGTTFAGPSMSITAKRDADANVSASITASTIAWSPVYSFSSQNVSGSLSYQVTGSGCSGWNVQMSASKFTYSGSAAGTAIPNGNASVTPGAPSAVTGSLTGLTTGSGGALSSSQKVLSASATNGLGTYNQSLSIGVTIPGGARVGVYMSTITITAAAGP